MTAGQRRAVRRKGRKIRPMAGAASAAVALAHSITPESPIVKGSVILAAVVAVVSWALIGAWGAYGIYLLVDTIVNGRPLPTAGLQ